MNLQLSEQVTAAITTHHGSRVAITIGSSHLATKATVNSEVRVEKIGHSEVYARATLSFLKMFTMLG